jgi:hypothetical protein
MQTGINNITQLLSIIDKLVMTFSDACNPPKICSGSGFWISTAKNPLLFVTNKHNLIPRIKDPAKYGAWNLTKLEIKCRAWDEKLQRPDNQTSVIDCKDWIRVFNSDPNSPDVAILIPNHPITATTRTSGTITPIPSNSLAGNNWFESLGKVTDHAYFIGFPDIIGKDAHYEYPISRNCHISSDPFIDFTEETKNGADYGVKTKNTSLVTGLSFGGSSGSPIFTYEVGLNIPKNMNIHYSGRYVEPKLIGIMSGHWFDKDKFLNDEHKGLSYFTKSTAILDLITTNCL